MPPCCKAFELTSACSYYIGTGLISVVGISFAIIPVAQGALSQMYANGFCPMDGEGNKLPCPDGYGGESDSPSSTTSSTDRVKPSSAPVPFAL